MRAHHGRVTDRLPAVGGFAVKLPAAQAHGAARAQAGRQRHAQLARAHRPAVDAGTLGTNFPKTVGADQALGRRHHRQGRRRRRHRLRHQRRPRRTSRTPTARSRVMANVIANPGATRPGDDVGHGTHVAGIIAGNSFNRAATTRCAARYIGIAPEADLVAIKTADDAGNSTVLDVINGAAVRRRPQGRAQHPASSTCRSARTRRAPTSLDPLDAAVEFAWHAGIVVVAAVGQPRRRGRRRPVRPGQRPVRDLRRRDRRGRHGRPGRRHARDLLEPRRHPGRPQQAGRRRARARASSPRWPPAARSRRCARSASSTASTCKHRRHLDGRPGRRRRRGAAPPGPPGPQPGPGQGAPDHDHQPDRRRLASSTSPSALRRHRSAPAPTRAPCRTPQVAAVLVAAGVDPTRATLDQGDVDQGDAGPRRPGPRRPGRRPPGPAASPRRWAKATWTCDGCSVDRRDAAAADPTSATWSKSSWSKSSWSSHPEW